MRAKIHDAKTTVDRKYPCILQGTRGHVYLAANPHVGFVWDARKGDFTEASRAFHCTFDDPTLYVEFEGTITFECP